MNDIFFLSIKLHLRRFSPQKRITKNPQNKNISGWHSIKKLTKEN
jgi:hypothetical protein